MANAAVSFTGLLFMKAVNGDQWHSTKTQLSKNSCAETKLGISVQHRFENHTLQTFFKMFIESSPIPCFITQRVSVCLLYSHYKKEITSTIWRAHISKSKFQHC